MRRAQAVVKAQSLADLAGGVELLIVQSRLAHPDPTAASGYEEEDRLAVLLLISPAETTRRWVRAHVHRYIGARAWLAEFRGADWEQRVVEHLQLLDAADLDLVLGLAEYSTEAEVQTYDVLRRLRSDGHHHVCTAVAVARDPREWLHLESQVNWVIAPQHTADEGAALLHGGLAQMAAPELIECIASDDLEEIWGSAVRPARLALADRRQLGHLSADDGGCGAVAVFCLDNCQLDEHRYMQSELTKAGISGPLIVAPTGLTLAAGLAVGSHCVVVAAA